MRAAPTVRVTLSVVAVGLILSASFFASAFAQNDIPFTYEVIDANQPNQSHCKAVGDIDGDGLPDVVVASANAGYGFYWYRYPSWTKYQIRPSGTGYTTDMQVADVDNDGDLDVVVPKGWDVGSSVYWYENPRPGGDPATDTWVEHSIGSGSAHDVEVADLNNDGKIDVVVRANTTTVFIQSSPTSWIKNQVNSRTIEGTGLGDLDGDGDIDIAINGYWLENPMPGGDPATDGWTEYQIVSGWPGYAGVHVEDMNEDGRLDVVLGPSETQGRLSWFEGPANPKGGSWTEHVISSNVEYLHTFKTADMDLDGDIDLVTAEMLQSSNPDEVVVWRNDGGATSWTKQLVGTGGSHNIRVADIGGDGDYDIVGVNWQGTTPVEMWHNELNPSYSLDSWDRHVVDSNKGGQAVLIDAGDLNGDGLPDIVTGGWWYDNPGAASGNWTRSSLGSPLNNMAAIYDFDGDGQLDVLGTEGSGSNSNPNLVWARNNGGGSFSILDNIESGPGDFLQGVAIAQFQSGGPVQVLLSWHISNSVYELSLPGDPVNTTWPQGTLASTSQEEDLSVGDIDRDGDLDVLLGTKWLRNDGGTWSTQTLSNSSGLPDRCRLADINNDGRLDAVVGWEFESKLTWYEQGAVATDLWTERFIATDFYAPMSMDVGDIDKDGDIDVVAGEHNLSNPGSARVHVFENVSNGASWTQHEVYTGDEHHDGTQLVDMDNDGDLDIISIGWSHNRVLLYENTSTTGGGPINRRPIAAMTATPGSGFAPLDVSFDASGSSDADGDPLTYSWTFGDGASATGVTASHTYAQTGSYTATVTVSDGELDAIASRTIVVSAEPGPGGIIAHWPLDETAGSTADDIQGTFDGTLVGGPAWLPAGGTIDGALAFDGSDDRVDVGAPDVSGGPGMTIAMWTRVDGFAFADGRFISKANGVQDNDHWWMLSTINQTGLRFRLKVDGTTNTLATGTGQFATGEWFHLAATYDGSQMRIYKNGVEVGSLPVSGTVSTNAAVAAALGNQPAGVEGRPLQGALDDVRLYTRALTEAELIALAGGGSGNQAPTASYTATPNSGQPPLDVSFDASASSDPDGDALTYAWDFGDGSNGSGVSPSHTFTQAGSYDVVLTVSDGVASDTETQTINVSQSNLPPVASFSATPTSGPAPLAVSFDASASSDPNGDPLAYTWEFGDGARASGETTSHTYTQDGTYTAMLIVADASLRDTTTQTITVVTPSNDPPTASFIATPTAGYAPLLVSFNAGTSSDPDGDVLTYSWDFGDGSSASGLTAAHTYTQTGTYDAELTVSDGEFDATTTRTIVVTDAPEPGALIAYWPLDESTGTTADDATGTNDGTLVGGPVWQPGGGINDGALSFDGVDDRVDIGNLDISGGSGMTIAMWTRVDGFAFADGRFISKANGVDDANHWWMLSTLDQTALRLRLKLDGTTQTLVTPTGQFASGEWFHLAATYDGTNMRIYKNGVEIASAAASGTISTDAGVAASLGNQPSGGARAFQGLLDDARIYSRALTATELLALAGGGLPNQPPQANFSVSPEVGDAPLIVTFDASGSWDPDGDPLTYSWAFGDGGTGSGASVAHEYAGGGTYDVTLTVSDGEYSATATQTVTVTTPTNDPPVASFTASPGVGTVPLTVTFDAKASTDPDGDPISYDWDFGDGNASTEAAPVHTFLTAGNFMVRLTVSDGQLTDTASRIVVVQEPGPALQLTLGILQNPYLTKFLDVYLVGTQTLDDGSVTVTEGANTVDMSLIDANAHLWRGDHELAQSGLISIEACARAGGGDPVCTNIDMSSRRVLADGGALLVSPDDAMTVRVADGGVKDDGYLLVMEADALVTDEGSFAQRASAAAAADDDVVASYSVGPATLLGTTAVTIEFDYQNLDLDSGIEASQLYIAQAGNGALPSVIDEATGVIRATATSLGQFSLVVGPAGTTPIARGGLARLHKNYPNPFNPSTTIPYELETTQQVRIAVYDVAGRLVAELVNAQVPAGAGQVSWDGRNNMGEPVGSGVYFVRLESGQTMTARKMMLVR